MITALAGCAPDVSARLAAELARSERPLSGGARAVEAGPGVRFDRLVMKSAHNAYERREALFDQLVYHRLRSLELDLHAGKNGWVDVAGDWYVYHDSFIGRTSSCQRLSDCMREIAGFRAAVPEHEALVVVIDLKDGFSEDGHRPADLDAALAAGTGPGGFFTPADLLAACPGAVTERQAVSPPCAWPTLDRLRGRTLVLVTGGDACDEGNRLFDYARDRLHGRLGFVAGELDLGCRFDAARPELAFFNTEHLGLVPAVSAGGLVTRVWGVDDPRRWRLARAAGAQILATNKVSFEKDPWARTHNSLGYPFACDGCEGAVEADDIVGVRVQSGDIWGTADSMAFVAAERPAGGRLEGFVSAPSSHIEPWGKGCFMARADDDPASPYFAVCRPADEHVIRVQWRPRRGAATKHREVRLFPNHTVEPSSAAWMRLEVTPVPGGTRVAGYASLDANYWVPIHQHTLPVALPRIGLAASSHGAPTLKLLFGGLRFVPGGAAPAATGAWTSVGAVGWSSRIGSASYAEVFTGPFPN